MARLPAKKTQKLARMNRRATVRYRCAPATAGKLYVSGVDELQRAWIINISKKGVGMVLSRALPKHALLVLKIRGARGPVDLPAQVVHATPHNRSEWMVGCELIHPLDDDELDALL